MSVTTDAVVNVKALQKSLNQMSRDERVEFIRANGDPKVSVQIAVRDADQPDAPPQPSPVAENILKERIKSFGFRTWAKAGGRRQQGRRFRGDRRSAGSRDFPLRLEASGLVVTKYALTSWTVKCVDLATGEEIYYNTALPEGHGQLGERGRGAEGDRREGSPMNSRAISSCSTRTWRARRSRSRRRHAGRRERRCARPRARRACPTVIAVDCGAARRSRASSSSQLGGTGAAGDLVATAC